MDYELKRRRGMRAIRLTVHESGLLVVMAPRMASMQQIAQVIERERAWIDERRTRYASRRAKHLPRFSRARYLKNKEAARAVIESRVGFLNEHYGFDVRRVTIRDQRTLWGSCSSGDCLNFNYRLLFLPHALQEYVVVHELCHLGQHNHSRAFWELVSRIVPDYRERGRALRRYRYLLW